MSSPFSISSEILNLSNDIKKTLMEFDKPILENRFFINVSALKSDAVEIDFDRGIYTRNPHRLSLDRYSDARLYQVILLANNVPSIFSFTYDFFDEMNKKVLIPQFRTIMKILSYRD